MTGALRFNGVEEKETAVEVYVNIYLYFIFALSELRRSLAKIGDNPA